MGHNHFSSSSQSHKSRDDNAMVFIQVSSLSRDMDRLNLAEASGTQEPSKEKMSEARKKELRKMSQKRRSSKQSRDNNIDCMHFVHKSLLFAQLSSLINVAGFLLFLDLAIAK